MSRYDAGDGSSSPFLEDPQGQNNSYGKNNDYNDKDAELLRLKYQFEALQNEFDINQNKYAMEILACKKNYNSKVDEVDYLMTSLQNLQNDKDNISSKLESLVGNGKTEEEFENQLKDLQEDNRLVKESLKNYKIEKQNGDRKIKQLEVEVESLNEMLNNYDQQFKTTLDEVKTLKNVKLEMEKEIVQLKQTGSLIKSNSAPNKEVELLQKELAQQVQYLRELESENLKQSQELKTFKQRKESVDFLTLENQELRSKLKNYETNLETQLESIKLENNQLRENLFNNDYKLKYDILYEKNNILQQHFNELQKEFDALVDKHSLLGKSNLEKHEIQIKNEHIISNLEKLNREIEEQKALSFEECNLLRQELDELVLSNNKKDLGNEQNNWNTLVDKYKNQSENLTNELKKINQDMKPLLPQKKRKLSHGSYGDDEDVEKINQTEITSLRQKNTSLENTVSSLESECQFLHKEFEVLQNSKEMKIRVLQLRESPINKDQFIKKKMLKLLKLENEELKETNIDQNQEFFPKSIYNRMKMEQDNMELELYKSKKQMTRLKEMFGKKSIEFIESVNQILGFKLEFLPGSKVKVTSCYEPTKNLEIDLINNTLKSSLSDCLPDWGHHLREWVLEKKQIPGLLATIQLELFKTIRED